MKIISIPSLQSLRPWVSSLALIFAAATAHAEWPQYRGPNLDGSTSEKLMLKKWPANGPRPVWKAQTPDGFSSFTVSGGRAYTQFNRRAEGVDREACVAFDANTGKQLWAVMIGISKYGHDGGNQGTANNKGGDGPRSTPTVDGNRVYVLSSDLVLFCLDAATGKGIWAKDLIKEHGAQNITWKNAASPVIDGHLIFVAGGGAGQSLLGIDKQTGKVVWKGQSEKITHSTPVVATIHGVRQVIFFMQSGLVSVAPGTGAVLWRFSFPFQTSTAMTPIVAGDIVFCSAGYHNTAAAARISKSGSTFQATELWRNKGAGFVNHWSTPVYHNGHIYGMFSFKEYGDGPLKCIELATGREKWSRAGFGQGNVTLVDGHLLALADNGELALVEATPSAYKEISRAKILNGKCWSTPVLSNGRIYARSTREAVCLDVSGGVAQR